ncbi:lys-63-specific deubiquitinase BRCC36-like protein [Baffinella frigidus]|nr:lys-63-specific deubiquitinase BRCC36-like protein [Cryptophyta sp. CCMP2293]
MAVSTVAVTADVLQVCMAHALSTEKEEIMGLLLGDVIDSTPPGAIPTWSDDRVEISPEQLAAASDEAERMSAEMGLTTRVVGWYHSHPHLAVVPSHVDTTHQAMYQQLDSAFVGLIFSCFNSGLVVPGVPTGTQALLQVRTLHPTP